MTSLHDTLKLNNEAVALYHSNDTNSAARAYYQSLCSVNRLLKECHGQEQIIQNGGDATNIPQHECLHTFAPRSYDNATTAVQNNEPFVYQGALILQECPSSLQNNIFAMTIYSAGILFNTAVLHHQEAIKTGSSSSMDRAIQLYEASLNLIGHLRADTNNTVSLIAIAASNNLAQLELVKGLLPQACKRLRFLKTLLHGLQPIVTEMFTMDEFHGMLSNTLCANGMIASAAA